VEKPHPWFWVGVASVSLLLVFEAAIADKLSLDKQALGRFRQWNLTLNARNKWLPGLTVAVIVTIAMMIFVSGGARFSNFTHFLVGTSTVAVVFASKEKTKISLMALSVTLFIVTRSFYFSVDEVAHRAVFDWISLAIALVLGYLAAAEQQSSPVNGSQPPAALPKE